MSRQAERDSSVRKNGHLRIERVRGSRRELCRRWSTSSAALMGGEGEGALGYAGGRGATKLMNVQIKPRWAVGWPSGGHQVNSCWFLIWGWRDGMMVSGRESRTVRVVRARTFQFTYH